MIIFISLTGCIPIQQSVVKPTNPYNPIKTVAVLPMVNNTNDVEGPAYVRNEFDKKLSENHYSNKSLKDIDQLLKDQMGITLGSQIDMTTPQKLGELLGVDAVIYGTLIDFDVQISGLYNVKKVRAKFKMVDTKTGEIIWSSGWGVKSETKSMGAAGEVLARVAGEMNDGDKQEKEYIPWVTIGSGARDSFTDALVEAVADKVVSQALRVPLIRETKEMIKRVMGSLPPGPVPYTKR
ncbi:MAG: DUF799 family lipoprotein [Deltaproteobacteria bacterium]|nr:DUF799 family lipoprotein [Deltaproteobacteria bacterium]